MGVRPEYFEDASLVDEAKRGHGSTFTARVDVTEWLGDSQYAYIPFDAPEEVTNQLRDLSRELDSDQLRTQAIVSIDATSRIREGRDAEFWIDTRKIHCFDPASGTT
jgi:multiple sugar transport system ATP-binding protein